MSIAARALSALLAALLGVVALVPASQAVAAMSADDMLDALTVMAEDTATYNRAYFGDWIDADNNGCNTRAEVLIDESLVATDGGCPVRTGKWLSYFDGVTWTQASDVDIDHMVPLSEAWDSGARLWTSAQRKAFANDLDWGASLVAVTDNVNQSKGDKDPAQWLPPSASATCRYIGDWLTVKYRWNLTVDTAEHNAIQALLDTDCSGLSVAVPPDAGTPGARFSDVPVSYPFYDHIMWMAEEGITSGVGDGSKYAPNADVTRGQMAVFLYKLVGEPAFDYADAETFSDVPSSHPFYKHISWMSAVGLTQGRADGTYGVDDPVSRAAMAAFLYKAVDSPDFPWDGKATFPDVPTGYTFSTHIEWLSYRGVTQGFGDGTFKPERPITRGQMAVFLYKFANL